MDAIQEKMEAEIKGGQEMKATARANQEKMETTIKSIWPALEIMKKKWVKRPVKCQPTNTTACYTEIFTFFSFITRTNTHQLVC
jgi:hypothetical protein